MKSPPASPRATYRLQFHKGFTLGQAIGILPYLADLGVSHVYASPLLQARPGSPHGYDVIDPTRLNPEVGSEPDLAAFVQTLRRHEMGLVLDIVPNHLAVGGPDNPWWWDLLRFGRASRFASMFDVDWESGNPDLRGRILLPVLGDTCDRVLERGEFRVDTSGPVPCVRYFDHAFPLSPETLPADPAARAEMLSGLHGAPNRFRELLSKQHYRLADWKEGDRHLNYRRFFNITHLAGLRVEDPAVFDATHRLVLEWHRRGWIDGFRVDHPDGLRDPVEYLRRLRDAAPGAWIIVEKILEPGEELRRDWPVAGTTGYDFLNQVGGLLMDPAAEESLTAFYHAFTGEPTDAASVVREKKRVVLEKLLAAEVSRLLRHLERIAAGDAGTCRLPLTALREGLVEMIACFPVYRTYVRAEAGAVEDIDRQVVLKTALLARARAPQFGALFDLLERTLLLQESTTDTTEFVMRFQQLTGPAMAKGLEDTTFYCFNRFIGLNEVGGDPGRFAVSPTAFHEECRQQGVAWPDRMLATSTHDTKRSEDVRARLSLLSEIPGAWSGAVRRWAALNDRYRSGNAPIRNAEYLFYQTLVGAWPISEDRILAYMEKAVRESRQHTTWVEPDRTYEGALTRFIRSAMADPAFRADLAQFVADLVDAGYLNSLTQTLLKLTSPGVPDLYQGTELWDFSLVDPDNRRPVDFDERLQALRSIQGLAAESVWARRAEGLPKLWLIRNVLVFRSRHPECFDAQAGYRPLQAEGPRAHHCVAYLRGDGLACVAPRLTLAWRGQWTDTHLVLPPGRWHLELTGEDAEGGGVPLDHLLRRFPVALLSRRSGSPF